MADQDFNIKVVTTADTSGLKATSAEMDAVQRKAASFAAQTQKQVADAEAKWAASAINPKNATAGGGAASSVAAGGGGGLSGTAIGIGTIVTLLTVAINKWKEFDDGLTKAVEKSLEAEKKFRELGESILDMQDKAISARRLATEPLEVSFARLTQDVTRLKTEISEAFEAGEYEDVKKLNAELATTQAQLKGVTSQLQNQADAAKKAAQSELEKRVPGLKGQDPVKEADAQTQAILKNEQAAAQAKAEGRDADAEMFQKSADQYKASATPQQLADLDRIHQLQDKVSGKSQPAYQPLSPEEFERRSENEEPGGAGRKLTPEEMRQRQLDNQADRYAGVQRTRGESQQAQTDREKTVSEKLDILIGLWR